ncbi:MAG: class A beta-lactamase-related serine hydrolase [Bacteroidetes bacterium]|nr:class A beta-lactamase-related serine hydrolase [Bacteroidota bacterium]
MLSSGLFLIGVALGAALLCGCSGPQAPDLDALATEIDSLVAAHPGARVSVSVMDPAWDISWHRQGDELYHAASTMKVPVLIELFRQVEAGRFSLDDEIVLRNEFSSIVDGSPYRIEDDSDDAIYEQLGQPMSLRQLAYNMTTVSSNLATNLLIDVLGADSVQATSERLGTRLMQTIRGVEDLKAFELGLSNRATSSDLALLMDRLRTGTAVSASADSTMRGILLDQVFNSMIPNGMPEGTEVAHKTGSITEIHHDAAIVYPKGGKAYVLVIMTGGIADQDASSALGSAIAARVHQHLRGMP